MSEYYVDPNAGGSDTGADWTNAWTTLQRAIDGTDGTQPAAGDTVYCRNSGAGSGETLGAAVDVDGNNGASGTGFIKYIGCNASGTVDGTRYELDADSTAANCLSMTTAYIWFENFEFKNATGNGVTRSGNDMFIFINCSFNNNGGDGYGGSAMDTAAMFIRCLFHNNTNHGVDLAGNGLVLALSAFYSNGDSAYNPTYTDGILVFGNVIHDNGDNDNQIGVDGYSKVINNVIDGTNQTGETGLFTNGYADLVMFNRFTNLATGINANSKVGLYGWNLFYNNTNDTSNATYLEAIRLDGTANTNDTTDGDADDGYNAAATDDFNLKASRTYNGDGNDVIDLNIGS